MIQRKSTNLFCNGINKLLLALIFVLLFSTFASAATTEDQLHLNIQVTNSSGSILTGTYNFTFNITTASDCTGIVYTNSTEKTTDDRGVISHYLKNTDLAFDQQYWLCYYRNGTLESNSQIARTPYTFDAKNVSASGVKDDSNLNLATHNITADFGFLNISWDYITDKPANLDTDSTDDLTTSTSWSGDLEGTGDSPTIVADTIGPTELDDQDTPNDNEILAYDSGTGRLYWKTDDTGSGSDDQDLSYNTETDVISIESGNSIDITEVDTTLSEAQVDAFILNNEYWNTSNFTSSEIADWAQAFAWGDHSTQNYNDLDVNSDTDLDSTDDLTTGTTLGGDVSGTYLDLQLGSEVVTEVNINSSNAPTTGYILAYNTTSGQFYWKVDIDTHVAADGDYLYNDSTTMYLNGTKINQTTRDVIANQDIYVLNAGDTIAGDLNITGNLKITESVIGNGYFHLYPEISPTISSQFVDNGSMFIGGGTFMYGGGIIQSNQYGHGLLIYDFNESSKIIRYSTSGEFDGTNLYFCDYTNNFSQTDVTNHYHILFANNPTYNIISHIVTLVNDSCVELSVPINGVIASFNTSYFVTEAPTLSIRDGKSVNFDLGGSDNSNFDIHFKEGMGDHGVTIESNSYSDNFVPFLIDTDFRNSSGMNTIVINVFSSTGSDGVTGDMISMTGDATGFNNSDVGFITMNVAGEGDESSSIYGIDVSSTIDPIIRVGTPESLDASWYDNTTTTLNLTSYVESSNSNIAIFENQNSIIYFGNSGNFTKISIALSQVGSADIDAVYYYCNNSGGWETLTISSDTTNGFRNSGYINFINPTNRGTCNIEIDDTPFNDTVNYTYIAIKRTRNTIVTPPIESLISISGGSVSFALGKDYLNLQCVSSAPHTCAGSYFGEIYCDSASVELLWCDGTSWIAFAETSETTAHNSLTGLQGGTTAEYYHLTSAEYTYLSGIVNDVLLKDGSVALTGNWNYGTYDINGSGDINTTGQIKTDTIISSNWTNVTITESQINDFGSYQPLDSTLTDIADGTINENLVNTDNPWEDNEVENDITIESSNIVNGLELNTYSYGTISDPALTIGNDTDTGLYNAVFDQLSMVAGGVQFFTASERNDDQAIVNEHGADIDFRVETNTLQHAIFADAILDRVGINDSSPDYLLDINGEAYASRFRSDDWSNISVTESQISDLAHTTDTNCSVTGSCGDSVVYLNYVNIGNLNISGNINGSLLINHLNGVNLTTVQHLMDTVQSSGKIDGGSFIPNDDGTINISAGRGIIRSENDINSPASFFEWSASNNLALVDDTTNYVYVDYSGGTPVVGVETTKTANNRNKILLGKVFREGTELHTIEAGMYISELAKNTLGYLTETFGEVSRTSGYVVSESGERYLITTSGVLWAGLTRIITSSFNSSDNSMETYYRNGTGGWNETHSAQINNTYYDDGSGTLNELTVNRYGVHWVYGDSDGHLMIVYGQGDYTLALAESAQPPSSLPNHVDQFGFLAAKIIIQKGNANIDVLSSAYDTTFTPSGTAEHNELSGIQGGTGNEYYHLTSNQYATELPQWNIAYANIIANQTIWETDNNTWNTTEQMIAAVNTTGLLINWTTDDYLLKDGSTALTGNWQFGTFDINGSGDINTSGQLNANTLLTSGTTIFDTNDVRLQQWLYHRYDLDTKIGFETDNIELWIGNDKMIDLLGPNVSIENHNLTNADKIFATDWTNVTITQSQISDFSPITDTVWLTNTSDIINQSGSLALNYTSLDGQYIKRDGDTITTTYTGAPGGSQTLFQTTGTNDDGFGSYLTLSQLSLNVYGSTDVGIAQSIVIRADNTDGDSQTITGTDYSLYASDAGDTLYGMYIDDRSTNNGTAYGLYMDIDGTDWATVYSIYVAEGGATSFHASNFTSGDALKASDWTNVTITKSQVSDFGTYVPAGDLTSGPLCRISGVGVLDCDLDYSGWDLNSGDDFDGAWSSLTGAPENQTLSYSNGNITISGGNSVNISGVDTDTQLSEASVEAMIFDADNTGNLETTGDLTAADIYINEVISSGDIYTTGAYDDLWLGTSAQINALFRAYANGSVYASDWTNVSITESQIIDLDVDENDNIGFYLNDIAIDTSTYDVNFTLDFIITTDGVYSTVALNSTTLRTHIIDSGVNGGTLLGNINVSQNITTHESSNVCNADRSTCWKTYVDAGGNLVTEEV